MELLDCVTLQTGRTEPAACVLWMHGLGADGYDFVPVVRELEALGAPPARYVFPHAPTMPVTLNNGYVMRAWYDILGTELVRREDEGGIRASQQRLEALIARELARGIAPSKLVLAGFSQGGAMALQTALRHPQRLAGVLALSCYLPLADSVAAERHAANHATPVFMAHGTADPMIPLARAEASRDRLQALGMPVEWHTYPMQHAVCEDEIRAIAAFLKRVL